MTLVPLVWMLLGAGANAPEVKLRLSSGSFVVTGRRGVEERISLDAPKRHVAPKAEFRSDETFVIWDDRGLTIRAGGRAASTRLKEIPTSPRLREREAIIETVKAVRDGGLSLDATALSGARRIGKMVYLILRWETEDRHAWLEALVVVDLAAKLPAAKALAVLPGISFSSGPLSESLISGTNSVSILIHTGSVWGVWTYNPEMAQSTFRPLGEGIKFAAPVSDELAAFVEKTEFGTYAAGTVDMVSGARSDAVEAPSLWKMIDAGRPPIAQATRDNGSPELAELETGAVLELPPDATVRRAEAGVLVWVGGRHPTRAWLYDPTAWIPLAWWRKQGEE